MLCTTPLSLHVASELCRSPNVCCEGKQKWESKWWCVCGECDWDMGNTLWLEGYLGIASGILEDECREDEKRRRERKRQNSNMWGR